MRHITMPISMHYQDQVAVFSIDPVELLAGSLPKRQQRLVEGWAELHQQELVMDYKLSQNPILKPSILVFLRFWDEF